MIHVRVRITSAIDSHAPGHELITSWGQEGNYSSLPWDSIAQVDSLGPVLQSTEHPPLLLISKGPNLSTVASRSAHHPREDTGLDRPWVWQPPIPVSLTVGWGVAGSLIDARRSRKSADEVKFHQSFSRGNNDPFHFYGN